MRGSTWYVATGLYLICILIITLSPQSSSVYNGPALHLLDLRERWLADWILNCLLFIPLGLLLGARGLSLRSGLLLASFVSLGIECAQFLIPGRLATALDILSNSAGCGVGMLLFSLLRRGPAVQPLPLLWGNLLWTVGCLISLPIAAHLMRPHFPETQYYGQWNAELAHLESYSGKLTDATLGPFPLPSHVLKNSAAIRQALQNHQTLELQFQYVVAPEKLAPLFSIFDENQQEIVLVGVAGQQLIFRQRRNALAYGLDQADFSTPQLNNFQTGKHYALTIQYNDWQFCSDYSGQPQCSEALGWERLWSFLRYPESWRGFGFQLLDWAWLTCLTLPLAWYNSRSRQLRYFTWLIPGITLWISPYWGFAAADIPAFLAITSACLLGILLGHILPARKEGVTN